MSYRLHHREQLGSTQDLAREWLTEGAEQAPFVLLADRQTTGRGRHGRQWESPRGNLSMTCAVRPDRPLQDWSGVSLVVGVAVSQVLRAECPALDGRLRLKWPNDLMVDGAKLGGILCEAEPPHMLIGIGLNIAEAPPVPDRDTVALADLGLNRLPSPQELATGIATALDHWLRLWAMEGMQAIRSAWLADGPEPGSTVTANGRTGRFAGLGPRGEVLLAVDVQPDWELPPDRI
ncbi:MAG: hypothetical protein Alpg2KO_28910 [Alphaproteobacteria bacterium]